ncbi:MAG: hypothetical protein Q8M15_00560 [Bacteroidota bacterium]|nr:hypothetical protein [Bacteroidota bacterium]
MKKLIIITILFVSIFHLNSNAQEKFGKALNLGVGVGGYYGYYDYAGRSLPIFHLNYEFDVAKSFTLAPFVSFYSYSDEYYWGNKNYPERWYTYRETVIPIGIKGTYYFDELLKANSHWDFYLAGSLGFAIIKQSWSDGYYGDRYYYNRRRPSALFLDLHIGAEYHFTKRIGAFLDLSTGVSTIGLAIH